MKNIPGIILNSTQFFLHVSGSMERPKCKKGSDPLTESAGLERVLKQRHLVIPAVIEP